MKNYQICGLGNGIVDATVSIEDSFLNKHEIAKSSMTLIEKEKQLSLLKDINPNALKITCGGSVGNTVYAFAQLGGTAAMSTALGKDNFAHLYLDQYTAIGVDCNELPIESEEPTGSCLVMVTPDSERTMCTHLGATAFFDEDNIDLELVKNSRYLVIEGYLCTVEDSFNAVLKTIIQAKESGVKTVLTLSADFVVEHFKNQLLELQKYTDILVANKQEITLYTGIDNPEEAAKHLAAGDQHEVLVTKGEEGAYFTSQDETLSVPAKKCKPIDLTGAGDSYLAGFLYGIAHGLSKENSMKLASDLAAKVIEIPGPRLENLDLSEYQAAGYIVA